MRQAFKILPDHENIGDKLIIEAGHDMLSFLFFDSASSKITGLLAYNMEQGRGTLGFSEAIEKIWQEEIIVQNRFRSVSCFVDSMHFSLVPAALEISEDVLNYSFGPAFREIVKTDLVGNMGILAQYRIEAGLHSTLERLFGNVILENSTSCQLKYEDQTDLLTAIVLPNTLKIILFRNAELKIAKHFTYTTATDAAYHLLNVCHQFEVNPSEITLALTGLVDKESILFQEIYKYFLDIRLKEFTKLQVNPEFEQYPKHYFSHLFTLVSCVS